jgi:FMN phosphatase YigB (HAD superfamily)
VSTATPIQTIFWDLGGVLLTNGWDKDQRTEVLTSLDVDLDAYEALHDQANFFWERGLMTAQDFFGKTVLSANPGITFDQLWPLVCAQSKVLNPECFDILSALKATGRYRIATLNNESRELNAHRLDAFNLRQYFDYFICSGYVHEMKPAPGIYRDAIDISGRPAETSLFIDDKAENCAAAQTLGMQAIVFQSPAQLRRDLAKHAIANL